MNESTRSLRPAFGCVEARTALQAVNRLLTVDPGRGGDLSRCQKCHDGFKSRRVVELGQEWVVDHTRANLLALEQQVSEAQLPTIWLDDLRHLQAMVAMQEGVPMEAASEWQSRKGLKFTRKQYVHLAAGVQVDAGRSVAVIDSPDMAITISCHTHELPSVETSARDQEGSR